MDLKVTLCGIQLSSPLIIGSGPIGFAAEGMIRAHRHGAGAVVTKTIRSTPAVNPYPHIALSNRDSMINSEKWSDFDGRRWIEKEIPEAKAAGVIVVGSIGHTCEETETWVPEVDRAGADLIELVSYTREEIIPMVRLARRLTSKPLLVKLSPNWAEPSAAALMALEAGADGLTVMDSIGPVLRIDIETRTPLVGGPAGRGWLTGAAIKPIALHYVAQIASQTDRPIVGLGGVMNAEDGIEMLMAGAAAIGICTAPMVKGLSFIGRMNRGLSETAGRLGFSSIASITGAALPNLGESENRCRFQFDFTSETCIECGKCSIVCPYQARSMAEKNMFLDEELCRWCGLCASVCPTRALRIIS